MNTRVCREPAFFLVDSVACLFFAGGDVGIRTHTQKRSKLGNKKEKKEKEKRRNMKRAGEETKEGTNGKKQSKAAAREGTQRNAYRKCGVVRLWI